MAPLLWQVSPAWPLPSTFFQSGVSAPASLFLPWEPFDAWVEDPPPVHRYRWRHPYPSVHRYRWRHHYPFVHRHCWRHYRPSVHRHCWKPVDYLLVMTRPVGQKVPKIQGLQGQIREAPR